MKARQKTSNIRIAKAISFSVLFSLFIPNCFGLSEAAVQQPVSPFFNPLFITLSAVIILLFIIIIVFADVVKAAAHFRVEKEKEKKQFTSAKVLPLLLVAFLSLPLFGQVEPAAATIASESTVMGLDNVTLYFMLSIILFELLIAGLLYNVTRQLLKPAETEEEVTAEALIFVKPKPTLLEKINASVALEEEGEIMLDHNYDGIRELDNNLPPWWKYGFYLTIVVAFVYMINFHVTGTGMTQLQEYQNELAQGAKDVEEYRKKAANLVDENNVTQLTDASSLLSGGNIYKENCAACHGQAGEGGVGPNLTDDYWVHNGSIKDVFRSIKFGWPESGMKSWQQDLGGKQIHEVASYIKSLRGTNPGGGKEKQGELFVEEVGADSSASVVSDTIKINK